MDSHYLVGVGDDGGEGEKDGSGIVDDEGEEGAHVEIMDEVDDGSHGMVRKEG